VTCGSAPTARSKAERLKAEHYLVADTLTCQWSTEDGQWRTNLLAEGKD